MLPPAIKATLAAILALVLIIGAHAFLSHERQIGYDAAMLEVSKRDALAKELNDLRASELIKQRDRAIAERDEREKTIRNLATASGNASLSLRDTVNAIRASVPSASIEALRKSTDTLGTVFNECQARYRELAEKADRHANDVQALNEAFPQSEEVKNEQGNAR